MLSWAARNLEVRETGGAYGVWDVHAERARARMTGAFALARRGRSASAERELREALGIFERRRYYACAARAAATLGHLLGERGQVPEARAVVDRARLLCEAARRERVLASMDTAAVATMAAREDQAAALALIEAVALPDPSVGREASRGTADTAGLAPFAEDVVRLVEVGRGDADEAPILAAVCELIRQQVGACTVAASALEGGGSPLACAGLDRCLDAASIRRAVQGGVTRPVRTDGGCFIAAPIGDGSRALAVLVACWRAEAAVEGRQDVWLLLSVGAAVCGPDVRALLDRRLTAERRLGRGLLGRSPKMTALRRAVERAAASPFPVLIEGETGSGKEVVAGELHRLSARRSRAFCAVNCAALSDELFEAELFGHARGAFTGAVARADRAVRGGRRRHVVARRGGGAVAARPGPSYCGRCRPGRSAGWARTGGASWTSTSSRRPTARWEPRSRPGASGAICGIAWTWCASRCPRCGLAARTSRCWPRTSGTRRWQRPADERRSRPRRSRRSVGIGGRATCANSRTSWRRWPCRPAPGPGRADGAAVGLARGHVGALDPAGDRPSGVRPRVRPRGVGPCGGAAGACGPRAGADPAGAGQADQAAGPDLGEWGRTSGVGIIGRRRSETRVY